MKDKIHYSDCPAFPCEWIPHGATPNEYIRICRECEEKQLKKPKKREYNKENEIMRLWYF